MAIWSPFLSVSSLTSDIPSTFFSILISSIFLTKAALFTSYGISLIIICFFPLFVTTSYLHLTFTLPFPVVNASLIPFMPSATPPVGKSGPFTISNIVSKWQFGLSILLIVASIISPKLWGGILVA